jgi:hypothetical protein
MAVAVATQPKIVKSFPFSILLFDLYDF